MQGKVSLSRSSMPRMLRSQSIPARPTAIADRLPNPRESSQVRNLHHKRRSAPPTKAGKPGSAERDQKDPQDFRHCTLCGEV